MLTLSFNKNQDSDHHILCLGAHSDDIEIGCGGTILRLIDKYSSIKIHWIVFSAQDNRKDEAYKSANSFLDCVGDKSIVIKNYRDGFFPYIGQEIKEFFESLKQQLTPDIIFTHYRHDLHQDHRLIWELTWNTFRDHLILEYEVPKYDGDLGNPNCFIHLDEETAQMKIDLIINHFLSQHKKHWFNDETLKSIMHLRGIESRAPENYAEAFYIRKIVI